MLIGGLIFATVAVAAVGLGLTVPILVGIMAGTLLMVATALAAAAVIFIL